MPIPQSPASGKIGSPFLEVKSCAKAVVTPKANAKANTDFFMFFSVWFNISLLRAKLQVYWYGLLTRLFVFNRILLISILVFYHRHKLVFAELDSFKFCAIRSGYHIHGLFSPFPYGNHHDTSNLELF